MNLTVQIFTINNQSTFNHCKSDNSIAGEGCQPRLRQPVHGGGHGHGGQGQQPCLRHQLSCVTSVTYPYLNPFSNCDCLFLHGGGHGLSMTKVNVYQMIQIYLQDVLNYIDQFVCYNDL